MDVTPLDHARSVPGDRPEDPVCEHLGLLRLERDFDIGRVRRCAQRFWIDWGFYCSRAQCGQIQVGSQRRLPNSKGLGALSFRSTSRPSDAAICASILLGSGLEEVLSAPGEKKMQTLWKGQGKVPTSVPWVSGPRLDIEGFRWAPSNLLHPVTSIVPLNQDCPPAQVTPSGLLVPGLEAILLRDVPLPAAQEVYFQFQISDLPGKYILYMEEYQTKPWAAFRPFWTGSCALFLGEWPSRDSEALAAFVAVIISAKEAGSEEDQVKPLSARYLAVVAVCKEEYWYRHKAPLSWGIKRQQFEDIEPDFLP